MLTTDGRASQLEMLMLDMGVLKDGGRGAHAALG